MSLIQYPNVICLQFPITAIREIKILKKLHHDNVIKLKEIVTSPGNIVVLHFNLFVCVVFVNVCVYAVFSLF